MKKLLLIAGLLLAGPVLMAQKGSWKIKLNNKTLLATRLEDPEKNGKRVKGSEWKKNGKLEILFTEDEKDTWMRSFQLTDEDGQDILSKDSTLHAVISLADLRKAFAGKKQIRIYTTISPLDPHLAIRIRRVHLCTLQLP